MSWHQRGQRNMTVSGPSLTPTSRAPPGLLLPEAHHTPFTHLPSLITTYNFYKASLKYSTGWRISVIAALGIPVYVSEKRIVKMNKQMGVWFFTDKTIMSVSFSSATDVAVKGNEILENCCGFRKPLCGRRGRTWWVLRKLRLHVSVV